MTPYGIGIKTFEVFWRLKMMGYIVISYNLE